MTPDHLGIQLLFANLLIEKYLTEDDFEIRAMIGKDLLDFINGECLTGFPDGQRQSPKAPGPNVIPVYQD
jgi:hypothetical protein